MSPDDIQHLARELAARMAPDALLDANDVAALLKYEPRYVSERLSRAEGFPRCVKIPGVLGTKGQRRWVRSDIVTWYESIKAGKKPGGGRARKSPDID